MPNEGARAALNGVCPYYTMFPLEFPLGRLAGAKRGDWVIDPFCGRGTTNFAARMLGLNSLGIDSNPVAAAISAAKIAPTQPHRIVLSAKRMLSDRRRVEVPTGEFWRLAFHPETLRDLCKLRRGLQEGRESPSRVGLRAILLGALHGPLRKGDEPDYFSNQMPRTYAAKPGYAVRFWKRRGFKAPKVNVLRLVERRARRYFDEVPRATAGSVLCQDSRLVNLRPHVPTKARWVVTSPPYLGMRTYVQDQWLRYWFLGGPSEPRNPGVAQLAHSSPDEFAHQLALVWRNLASVCASDATMFIRFGGIRDRAYDSRKILRKSIQYAADVGWRLRSVQPAGHAATGKRQAEQFGLSLDDPVEEFDFVANRN